MWGLELPYRRYSVPETIMRKVRLRQSSSSSSESSSRRVTRRPIARARNPVRNPVRNRYCMNTSTKSVQTSPYSNHCIEVQAENPCLLHSRRHHGQPRRATSVPDLSSDAESRIDRRPSSARDKLLERYTQPTCNGPPIMISPVGTPSPSQASNYSGALHRCDVYSNTWSYTTSSEYTLGQTVSDRTTSTQDSTLSIQSSTPESSTSNSFSSAERAAQKIFLENSIFSPAGNFIAVHTESLLIQPIEIIERRENWNFGFSDSPESDPFAALSSCHRSIAVNTEPPEMIGAFMVDKSTCAYGVFNDKSAQVRDSDIENELMIDKSTYIEMLNGLLRNGNGEEDSKEVSDIQATEEPQSVDIGINTDQCTAILDDEKDRENQFSEYPHTTPLSRRAVFKIPNIKIFKGSTTESQQTDDWSNVVEEAKMYVTKSTSVEEKLFRNIEDDQQICSKEELTEEDNTFNKEIKHLCKTKSERSDVCRPFERKLCADIACTGCNYKDYPEVDGVIARYSAIPRSNSMLVNTSSIDYSSDSDLSLTDSLEDCNEHRAVHYDRPNTRHDNRLVRGEVSLEQEQTSKRYPKSNKAYAYFLSITGEQDMVKQCPLPDWLKVRLQRREEEIKKLFQIRLNKHQTIVYRKRKKTMKRITENEDSNSTASKGDTLQKVQKRCAQDAENAGKGSKYIETADTKDMPSTSEANNINGGEVLKGVLQVNSNSNPIEAKTTIEETKNGKLDLQQNTNKDNNYLHISEVIKIEMLNSLNTVITKEKQINLNTNLFTRDQNNFQTSECIKNESSLNIQKIIMKTNIGNLQIDNNSLPELENECQISSKEKDEDTVKIKDTKEIESKTKEKAIIKKRQNESYSLKQFKPLFQSKADDQTVAEILLSAMENNASLKNDDDKEFQTKEGETSKDEHLSLSNTVKTVDGHMAVSTKEETPKLKYNNVVFNEPKVKIERSCNTVTPYLSAIVQTKESFLKEKSFSFAEREAGEIEEFKDTQSLIKAESTQCIPMTSSLVQTNETFLENEKSFIESESLVLIRDQGTDVFRESSDWKNENEDVDNPLLCNLENDQVSVFVQTEQNVATINEVKPLIIHSKNEEFIGNIKNDDHNGKTYTCNKKLNTNSNKSRRHGMDVHKQNCKYYSGGSHEHKASQVLELNVQPCTCHMCTLNKKVCSRNDKLCEGYHGALQSSAGIRRKLLSRSSPSEHKEEKKTFQKYSNNKRSNIANKFQRRFEVIPEEKNSSTESVGEMQVTPLKFTPDKKTCESNNFEKARLDQDEYEKVHTSKIRDNREKVTKELRNSLSVLKESENVMYSSEVKSTQTNGSKQSNVVFGRFKAIKNDARNIKEKKMLGEEVEVIQQYKGRAALAAAPMMDGQEQLLTLSKGWINFYLLKDNQEFSDSNNDEVQQFHSESLVQRAVSPIRILKGTEFKEEKVEEFTVEIRATPEPIQPNDKSLLLPNLHHDILRKRKTVKAQPQNNTVFLPEIQTSSSSSTPENLAEKIVPIEGKSKKCHPLPVVNGRRSSRHEIRMKRESVTAFEQIPKPEPLLRLAEEFASGFEKGHSAKAVEVALSEHSVSSISSTLILSEESPSPKHERKSRLRQRGGQIIQQQDRNGSSWTVTVAGTSGNNSNVHPDVEMKLTFGNKQTGINNKELCDENEKRLIKFDAKKSSRTSSSKRKGRMMEEYAHTSRDEKQRSIQYMPGVMLHNSQESKFEGTLSHKDLGGYLDHENTSQFSRRSKGSIEGSSDATSLCSDLQVTGLAITPESKPYVPTQSERDLVRRQRYKFTR